MSNMTYQELLNTVAGVRSSIIYAEEIINLTNTIDNQWDLAQAIKKKCQMIAMEGFIEGSEYIISNIQHKTMEIQADIPSLVTIVQEHKSNE